MKRIRLVVKSGYGNERPRLFPAAVGLYGPATFERRRAERLPDAATMIATPGEPDVTTPCGETPATPGLVEDHVT